MLKKSLIVLMMSTLLVAPVMAQETPPTFAAAYESLADTILAVRGAELHLVAALLDGHRHAAEARMKAGDWKGAAAEIAVFANEGDNSIAGVRKRLLEGGHHYNAEGEKQGVFEPGYVIVTREAKEKLLGISTAMRQATTDEARQKAWSDFEAASSKLLDVD
jgi:hypothetical protein